MTFVLAVDVIQNCSDVCSHMPKLEDDSCMWKEKRSCSTNKQNNITGISNKIDVQGPFERAVKKRINSVEVHDYIGHKNWLFLFEMKQGASHVATYHAKEGEQHSIDWVMDGREEKTSGGVALG